jgi:SAM-dependent methyltransferase
MVTSDRGADGDRRARERSRRARERQLAYQEKKARGARGREAQYIQTMREKSAAVRAALELVRPLPPDSRILEVGSGAHGLVFFFGSSRGIGIDPLAREYTGLFPAWQRRVPTLAAEGESLPFRDAVFDVALCDNVVDHAYDPARIASELARVLAPGGLLYFTVNVHHRVYAWAARAAAMLEDAGVAVPVPAFADHTVHLTPDAARTLFAGLPLEIVATHYQRASRRGGRKRRRATDVITALFFKNALFQIVAVRTSSPAAPRSEAGVISSRPAR